MADSILWGVSVGPGNPELLTLEAVRIIRACPVIAAPRTKSGAMTALDIVRAALDLGNKIIEPLDFAMSPDPTVCAASHAAAARTLAAHLDAGRDVALLNLGDISLYASFRYVADILDRQGYATRMAAGVPSFCAAAARLGMPLTDMTASVHVWPEAACPPADALQHDTHIWMKSGSRLQTLLAQLDGAGLLGRAVLVQSCGMADEQIYRGVAALEADSRYFSLVLLVNPPEGGA